MLTVDEVMKENERAKQLLTQKEKGVTLATSMSAMKRKLTYRSIMLVAACLCYWFYGGSLFILAIGMLVGVTMQDFGWLRVIEKTWPFTVKITDWEKVKRIAEEHD
ncbi:hypothetical protein [Microbulbifer sp. 2205BS26-8]|uniref:hypothetical protein n=1 Tax=Microbulbifer sp. 2205BS26-8 TaxID=3064386 RepID=UPI00273CFEED|nr:hypothetical protein [Microbulbifer sp. 2205BS26-8]MDP5211133.1 hypothetical protein [Microbulbifer sp. 2205BS26-8]